MVRADEGLYADILLKFSGDPDGGYKRAREVLRRLGFEPPLTHNATYRVLDVQSSRSSNPDALPPLTPASSTHANLNPAYLCPLTGIIMRNPVILLDTRITYEREAIECLLSHGAERCPVSGLPLVSGALHPDLELQQSIQAWASVHLPEILEPDGRLKPPHFPNGVDAAIQMYQQVPQQVPPPALARASQPSISPVVSASAPPPPPSHPNSDQLLAQSLQAVEARASSSQYVPTAPLSSHSLFHLNHLQRTRSQQYTVTVLAPIISGTFLVAFLISLARSGWRVAPIWVNPWIGVDAAGLLSSGATCTSCTLNGEWWRLGTSLVVPAGAGQVLLNGAMVTASAAVATRCGMPMWTFVIALGVGGVYGSVASMVASDRTVHSASGAIPGAAGAAALAAMLAVRRYLLSWEGSAMLMGGWLGVLLVASFAPFADTWSVLVGALTGGLCSSGIMAPFTIMRPTKLSERLLMVLQLTLAVLLIVMGASLLVAVLAMPRVGYNCAACQAVSCSNFLGWDCSWSYNPRLACQVLVYSDSSVTLVCPSTHEVNLGKLDLEAEDLNIDSACRALCDESNSMAPVPGVEAGPGVQGLGL